MADTNFVLNVKAAGPAEHPTVVVRVSNADEIGTVNVDVLPVAADALAGVIYWQNTDNTFWHLDDTGTGFVEFGGGGGSDFDIHAKDDIGEAIADDDEFGIANESEEFATQKSTMARLWEWVTGKMSLVGYITSSGVTCEVLDANGDVGAGATQVARGSHNHNSTYAQLAHAAQHTNGTDDIQSATASQIGLMTTAYAGKLDNIEPSADVTDATNVGSSIHGAGAKTTVVDADTVAMIDTESSNVLARVTFANVFGYLWSKVVALLTKDTPVAADSILIVDSEATNAGKRVTFTKMLEWIDANVTASGGLWTTIYSGAGLTPTDTNTVPYTGSEIEVGMGVRCTYDDTGGDDYYYGVVSAVSAATSFDTHLAIFNASYPVTKIEVCSASALKSYPLIAAGKYAGTAHAALVADYGIRVRAGMASAVGRVQAEHGVDDSAASTEPTYDVTVGGNSNFVFGAEVALSTTFSDRTTAPSFAHYTIAQGESIDAKISQASGGTPGHNAANASILVTVVPL
jgi:hypothetical protein